MAKSPQNAAAKAAQALAAKAAEEAKAREGAPQEGEQATEGDEQAGDNGPSHPLPPVTTASDEDEKRAFKAAHKVILGGKAHLPGAEIEITHEEWKTLRAHSSITGEWD